VDGIPEPITFQTPLLSAHRLSYFFRALARAVAAEVA